MPLYFKAVFNPNRRTISKHKPKKIVNIKRIASVYCSECKTLVAKLEKVPRKKEIFLSDREVDLLEMRPISPKSEFFTDYLETLKASISKSLCLKVYIGPSQYNLDIWYNPGLKKILLDEHIHVINPGKRTKTCSCAVPRIPSLVTELAENFREEIIEYYEYMNETSFENIFKFEFVDDTSPDDSGG